MSLFNRKKDDSAEVVLNKQLSVPSPMIIIAGIILASAIVSYIIPAGAFDRVIDTASGREVVDPSTFHYTEQNPTSFFALFMSMTQGFQGASDIIAFLFIIGGAFGIMTETGAINAFMNSLVRKLRGRELLMIPATMVIFSLGSAFAANDEEFIAFLPLILSICFALGFDSLTAVGIILGSTGAGYGAGCTNAFTVGVAQSISGLPMFSGIELRLVMLVILDIINISFVMIHARRVKKNPESSIMYEYDKITREKVLDEGRDEPMTRGHVLVLLGFVAAIVALVVGVIKFGFYIDELSALFLMLGVFAGIVGRLSPKQMADAFLDGCANMLLPCIMVGMCKATTIILTNASIMDTIIHALASVLNKIPHSLTAFGMFIVQDLFNLLVPSGSGQAAITMPIMAPLADLVGVTRQTSVLAFQMGDAFTNCITPASGMTMSLLTIAGVPIQKWWKFALPLVAIWWVFAFVVLEYATITGFGPF